jgi:hypothetical protein
MASTPNIPTQAGADLEVVPTVTAALYTAGNCIGGVMSFPNMLPLNCRGSIQSITLKFKGSAPVGNYHVYLFGAVPTGTFNDKAAPVINAADSANLLGAWALPSSAAFSSLGTHAVYELDTFGHIIIAPTPNLWAVVIAVGAPTPASTTDMSLRIGINW